jgi:hypothetical protein
MHSKMTNQKHQIKETFFSGFLERENPFLTTGYRSLGCRLRLEIQPGDLPRSLGG